MAPHHSRTLRSRDIPVLHWILQNEANAITCQLDARADRSYEVCIVPHWDPASAVVERFTASTPAFLRHAAVAKQLRESGWKVVDHVGAGDIDAAA